MNESSFADRRKVAKFRSAERMLSKKVRDQDKGA